MRKGKGSLLRGWLETVGNEYFIEGRHIRSRLAKPTSRYLHNSRPAFTNASEQRFCRWLSATPLISQLRAVSNASGVYYARTAFAFHFFFPLI